MKRKIKTFEGREIRGLRLKVYPTPRQETELADAQYKLRRLWNWLVARADDTRRANVAWASRNGAGLRPERPANDAGESAWSEYRVLMREWYRAVQEVLAPHRNEAQFAYRSVRDYCEHFGVRHDYQLYRHIFDIADGEQVLAAHLQQALYKAYQQALSATKRGASPPRCKKRDRDVGLQVGSGLCFRTLPRGSRAMIGLRAQGPQYSGRIDSQVKLPGIGWIHGCMGANRGLQESLYWVEGVSIVREADGWYAAIRQHVVVPSVPRGTGACGIDVGLVHMFAAVGDDGATLLSNNPRRGSRRGHLCTPGGYVELIAERQAGGLPVSRLHCRSARHVREVVRRELFPFTDRYEFVAVEDLPADIGQRGRPHLSFMRTIRAMLIQRYGSERVIDVDPTDTSRTCSACGEIQPRSWSDLPGRRGKCVVCGHSEHSDINAARNVLARISKSRAAE